MTLSEPLDVKLKVLAELVEHHVKEEESTLLPKLRNELSRPVLEEYGHQYLEKRHLTPEQLENHPMLEEEMRAWAESVETLSKKFKAKTEKLFESFRH